MFNPEHRLKPGRLFIKCISAESIRGRADNSNDDTLTPHLLFKLSTKGIQQSRIGTLKGYDVTFDNEVVSFDIDNPQQLLVDGDISLIVQLRDGLKGLIAQCKASITEVLLSSRVEAARSLSVLNPGDTSTNSTVNLTFTFLEANPGLLKLNLSTFKNCIEDKENRYVSVSTSDGQSNTSSLADSSRLDGGFSFWVDDRNWFGDIDIEIHEEGGDQIIGEGKLVIIDCLRGDDADMTSSLISMTWDRRMNIHTPDMSVQHCFLLAGIVRVKCFDANGVGDVAHPRVVVKTANRTYMTEEPTMTANSSLLWDNELDIPIVNESSLTIEYGDFDRVTGGFESLGSSDLNLHPLYMNASIDASVDLKHQNEVGEMIDGGRISLALQFVFEGPANVAFPRDQGAVQSYIPRKSDTITELAKNDAQGFSELDIRNAFNKIDLDKNGYIGAAELRHCLTCMGEQVSEAEIDMMISMLDLNGDGAVPYKSFKAMVESPDPANDDFSYLHVPTRGNIEQDSYDNLQEVFNNYVQAHNITKADVLRAWDSLRRSATSSTKGSSSGFLMGRNQLIELMPQLGDSVEVLDHLGSDANNDVIDGRQLVMCFVSLVGFSAEEKCKIAFDMFDVDRTGNLTIDQIEVLLTCTHFSKRETLKKKAYNLLRLVGDKNTEGVSMKSLTLGADNFPSLIFPSIALQKA